MDAAQLTNKTWRQMRVKQEVITDSDDDDDVIFRGMTNAADNDVIMVGFMQLWMCT